MRSKNKTRNAKKNDIKMQFEGPISRVYMFFWHGESEFEVHFETESWINGASAHAQ